MISILQKLKESEHRMSAEIAALIVTWNRKHDLVECIESLYRLSYPNLTVYVVDNASGDGTAAEISSRFPAVQLIHSEENLGFAEGNNLALRRILLQGADAVFLVNDDVVVEPKALDELIAAGLRAPGVGVLCPKVLLHGDRGIVWSRGGTVDPLTGVAVQLGYAEADDSTENAPSAVDYAIGCAMLVKTAAIRRAGLLDPRFFMYYEETDWCRRIRNCGFEIRYVPSSRVLHKVTLESTGRNSAAYYFTRNRLLYLQCSGTAGSRIARVASGLLASAVVHMVKGRREEGRLMFKAVLDYYHGCFGKLEEKR